MSHILKESWLQVVCLLPLVSVGLGAGIMACGDGSESNGSGGAGGTTSTGPTDGVGLSVPDAPLGSSQPGDLWRLEIKVVIDNQTAKPIPLGSAHFQLKTESGLLVEGSSATAMADGSCGDNLELSAGSQRQCTVLFDEPDTERATAVHYDTGQGVTADAALPPFMSNCAAYCERLAAVQTAVPCPVDKEASNHNYCMNRCESGVQKPKCGDERAAEYACFQQGPDAGWTCTDYGLWYTGAECQAVADALTDCLFM